MNGKQKDAIDVLRAELLSRGKIAEKLPNKVESDGFAFMEVDGVTVIVGKDGGYHVPAIRTYRELSLGGV
jgi:hypothetical protein